MTINTTFQDWGSSGLNSRLPQFERVSPNTKAIADHLVKNLGGQIVGGHNERPISGTQKLSAHAYGAASDWRYEPNWLDGTRPTEVKRDFVLARVVPWLIDFSKELGVQAIHDYVGDRIWRAGRTSSTSQAHTSWWKKQNGAGAQMGRSWARWLHIETTQGAFLDGEAIERRGIPHFGNEVLPPTPPADQYHPATPLPTLRSGSTGEWPYWLIEVLKFWGWYPSQYHGDRNDSKIGARSVDGIKTMQRALGTSPDGIYGPKTARAYSDFLTSINYPG